VPVRERAKVQAVLRGLRRCGLDGGARPSAVGKRIQAWAAAHHRAALDAAWAQITDGCDVKLGDSDVQLIATWIFNDREVGRGGTAAELYSRIHDLDA
jgi:hypothetical protein